jgi:hypothetical protein
MKITEIDDLHADGAPWTGDFPTEPLVIENGELPLPNSAGRGSDVDEAAFVPGQPRHHTRRMSLEIKPERT